MCGTCVKEEYPDRVSVCLDNGSYFLNFAGCAQCGGRQGVVIENRQAHEAEDGEETTTYQHICKDCRHVIANHEHVFRIEESYQVYEMLCLLCGRSEDQRSIMPCDPRGTKAETFESD